MKFKVRLSVEYEIERPDDWDADLVEFQFYDGSWCANNALDEIKEYLETSGECLCDLGKIEVLDYV